ncbi:MAG TPA: hypothetical protein VI732_05275, partial [Alphaproteobacteria bacterium]|nr:hypothetical protein [Alphaproteobacteria bacterium]
HEPTASAENFVSREPAPRPEHHEHREHRPHEPSAPPAAVESHGKSHAEEPDDRPKRRGWWQRLVE